MDKDASRGGEVITVIVPTKNTKEKYLPCTKCFKCKEPMKENKCGKFSEKTGDDKK